MPREFERSGGSLGRCSSGSMSSIEPDSMDDKSRLWKSGWSRMAWVYCGQPITDVARSRSRISRVAPGSKAS